MTRPTSFEKVKAFDDDNRNLAKSHLPTRWQLSGTMKISKDEAKALRALFKRPKQRLPRKFKKQLCKVIFKDGRSRTKGTLQYIKLKIFNTCAYYKMKNLDQIR